MNPNTHSDPTSNSPVVTIDAIWTAQQFERINTTLKFMLDAAEKQSQKEEAQDQAIAKLGSDISEVKADVRAIKEAKPPRVATVTIVASVAAVAVAGVTLLNVFLTK